MKHDADLLNIVQTVMETLERRQSFSPGMFEPLKPLFRSLGYESTAVYVSDDYPDRMLYACGYAGEQWFPPHVELNGKKTLYEKMLELVGEIPDMMVEPLFSHGRELGVIAATSPHAKTQTTRDAFKILAQSVSLMAYVERIRTNIQRERQEREVFFAQSLTSRLLIREAPRVKNLRIGFEFVRNLEAGGDFFDLAPTRDGGLMGFVGSCNGKGLRTVLEVCGIMRLIHREYHHMETLSDVVKRVNDYLVKEKHRAHQASLCIFKVDTATRRLRMAKAGRLGLVLTGPGKGMHNISAPGGSFLGMVDSIGVRDEEFDFRPGQAFFAVTEGFYNSRSIMDAQPRPHWFLDALADVVATRGGEPLANAIFEVIDQGSSLMNRHDDPMLAVSVEFAEGPGTSIRRTRISGRLNRNI